MNAYRRIWRNSDQINVALPIVDNKEIKDGLQSRRRWSMPEMLCSAKSDALAISVLALFSNQNGWIYKNRLAEFYPKLPSSRRHSQWRTKNCVDGYIRWWNVGIFWESWRKVDFVWTSTFILHLATTLSRILFIGSKSLALCAQIIPWSSS